MNTKKMDLSDLGHKKRALKAPVSLFKGEKLKAPKIVLSEFEKEIYHLATKRIRDSDPNPECVRIGRMSIALREFGDTMHPKKWVGTFAMNVYTEALMYDQNKLENPNLWKGFLTSAEVERQWCFCSSVTSCLQWKDTFPFYSGTFKAIARIIDVLSVCPRGEGADYAGNKADCLSTCNKVGELHSKDEKVQQKVIRISYHWKMLFFSVSHREILNLFEKHPCLLFQCIYILVSHREGT